MEKKGENINKNKMGKKGKENEKAWPSPPASPCDPFPHLETLLDSDRCAKRPQPLSLPDSYAPPLPPLLSRSIPSLACIPQLSFCCADRLPQLLSLPCPSDRAPLLDSWLAAVTAADRRECCTSHQHQIWQRMGHAVAAWPCRPALSLSLI